ncbi:heat shock factor protein 2 [Dermatophagoides farinae]|uniref:Heat shock factor protein 2 n=1 Tax=Dermatophagoides farinae TaxID=6954 RepID=A0A9D4PAU7_DERFA|nr:heat shock transcription factor, X-linked member 3-like [Dermatophagoides farinae]KAH7646460.1 heat shock factor protein 2 [Dermatophagoides farinae]
METDSATATNLLLNMIDNSGSTPDSLNLKQTLSELDRSEGFQNELAKAYDVIKIECSVEETIDEKLKEELEKRIIFLDNDLDGQISSIFIVNDQPKIQQDSSPIQSYSMKIDHRRNPSRKKNDDKYFPRILWRLINECTNDAIKWSSDGTAILIDYEKFQQHYLDTNHFKTKKIISFVRQLNLYGFNKVNANSKQSTQNEQMKKYHEFWNVNFKRDCPHLLKSIRRRTSGAGKQQMKDKENVIVNHHYIDCNNFKSIRIKHCNT